MVCSAVKHGQHPPATGLLSVQPVLSCTYRGFGIISSKTGRALQGCSNSGRTIGVRHLRSCSSRCSLSRSHSLTAVNTPRVLTSETSPIIAARVHDHIPDSLGWPEKTFSFIPQRVLGKGSSGHVFLAYDPLCEEAVAVKAVKKDLLAGDLATKADLFSALQKEVDIMAVLQGSQVVELKAVYEDSLFAYITMEVCDSSLQELIDCHVGPIPEPVVASYARQMLETLQHVHANRICYSDVKPANFLINASAVTGNHGAEVKLSDFGCSQDLSGDDFLTLRTGTPLYTAPEVFLGRYGLEADIWGVGVIVFRMLCGVYPFRSDLDEVRPSTMMMSILHDELRFSGTPGSQCISKEAKDLLSSMLTRCTAKRITAEAALQHPWLSQQHATHCHFVPFQHYEPTDDVVARNIEHFRHTARAVGATHANSQSKRSLVTAAHSA